VDIDGSVPAGVADLLFDPQTSGGLLFAIDGAALAAANGAFRAAAVAATVIGRVVPASGPLIRVG
jgi:selenide,water dikinase